MVDDMVSFQYVSIAKELFMELKKITIEVPADLLERATAASGQGITPTIRCGLEFVTSSAAYARLRQMKGKVEFSIRLSDLFTFGGIGSSYL
jgi:hypothetical protein